jgi:hypothetical protein
MFNYLDSINKDIVDEARYDDCKVHSYENIDSYQSLLSYIQEHLPDTKRVVDVGSNMNQYAFLFENAGIDYVGIDLWNASHWMKPYESEHTTFIGARYEDIADWFKDDVIISNLCIGYLVDVLDVKAKHLLTNRLNRETSKFEVKQYY